MATYKNAYTLLSDVRYGLNDHSTALVQGTATHSPFSNDFIMDRINRAQRLLYAKIKKHKPGIFEKSTTITGSSSVFSLPWDYANVIEFRDSEGRKVYPSTVGALPPNNAVGNDRLYRRVGNTFVLNKAGVSDTYTLYYMSKPRDIHLGAASDTDTLVATAPAIADYFNSMIIENITDGTVDTITDYTAARVVTITIDLDSGDYYGIVPEIPEVFHDFIAPRALWLCKEEHPVTQEKPSIADLQTWDLDVIEAIREFAVDSYDISQEEIWTDYKTGMRGGGVMIPGHVNPV